MHTAARKMSGIELEGSKIALGKSKIARGENNSEIKLGGNKLGENKSEIKLGGNRLGESKSEIKLGGNRLGESKIEVNGNKKIFAGCARDP